MLLFLAQLPYCSCLRAAALDVDLTAIAANYRWFAQRAGSAACAACVKADAYGLGLAAVARTLWQAGCRDSWQISARVRPCACLYTKLVCRLLRRRIALRHQLVVRMALAQRGQEQPRRMQRLEKIVAGGDKSRLVDIGFLGARGGDRTFAFGDPALEQLVGEAHRCSARRRSLIST